MKEIAIEKRQFLKLANTSHPTDYKNVREGT